MLEWLIVGVVLVVAVSIDRYAHGKAKGIVDCFKYKAEDKDE